jgi:hypothetical protein
MKKILITFVILFTFCATSFAQPDSNLKVVRLTNGNEYIGTIISDDGREMLFESTTVGKVYIKKTDVKSISNYSEDDFVILNDEKVKSNSFSTRYSFTTNALPIKKKDNYYMINLWGPEFHMAVADNFNVGIMTTWIGSPLALTTKYSFQTKNPKVNFSIGEIIGNGGYVNPSAFISLSFGNVTFGDRDKNLTLGVGYGYFDFKKNAEEEIPGTYISANSIPTRAASGAKKGVLGSIAASIRINEKNSFVFDSMFGLLKTDGTTSTYQNNPAGILTTVVTPSVNSKSFLILMPGFRTSQGEGRSVQFTLAGIRINETYKPIPFVTWFRKL